MSEPRVSVVIPTYNRAGYLAEAIDSVVAQSHDSCEILVADDGSEDETPDVLARYGGDIVFVKLEHSGLLGAVRNAGLRRARGELVAFLDSDDIWLPEKLERQISVLDRNPSVGLVCSNAVVIDQNGNQIRDFYLRPEQGSSGKVLEQLLDVNFVIVSSAVVRRELIDQAGGFREDVRLRGIEDYDLWLRVSAVSEVVYLPEALLQYREHAGSMRMEVPRTTHWISLLTSLDNLEHFLEESDPRRQKLLRRRRAELLVELARAQRSEVGRASALRSLRQATHLDARAAARQVLRSTAARALRSARNAVRALKTTS
jgi:glycosyltransferase involved in cell wall biosynthesis